MKDKLIKIHWIMRDQLGIDIFRFVQFLKGVPRFINNFIVFRKNYKGVIRIKPCLHDLKQESGSVKNEYFWQDLMAARLIYAASPNKHVDIGSRVDGFVAHVATFRHIEIFDIRAISAKIPGMSFKVIDMMDTNSINHITNKDGYCDSLSCLHAIEHFGLGRYGDPIDNNGYKKGIKNLSLLLKNEGLLYLSTPVGKERVEFNANWVFDPKNIIDTAGKNSLTLIQLFVINSSSDPIEINIESGDIGLLKDEEYNLGLFVFKKTTNK